MQVTGEHLKQVAHEVRGRITPEGAQALVIQELRDRDQADSDRWQVSHLPCATGAAYLLAAVCYVLGCHAACLSCLQPPANRMP